MGHLGKLLPLCTGRNWKSFLMSQGLSSLLGWPGPACVLVLAAVSRTASQRGLSKHDVEVGVFTPEGKRRQGSCDLHKIRLESRLHPQTPGLSHPSAAPGAGWDCPLQLSPWALSSLTGDISLATRLL